MCAIDGLLERVSKQHDALDKEALADLIKKDKKIFDLEKKLCHANIEKARLSIQSIAL